MPIYEYACPDCGHRFDALQKISDAPLQTCPKCSAGNVKKLISAASFVLKGSGWYKDHYGLKDGGSGDSGKDGGSGGSSGKDSGSKDSGSGSSGSKDSGSGSSGSKDSGSGSSGSKDSGSGTST